MNTGIVLPGSTQFDRNTTRLHDHWPHEKWDVLPPVTVTIDKEKFQPYHHINESEENQK